MEEDHRMLEQENLNLKNPVESDLVEKETIEQEKKTKRASEEASKHA